MKSILNITTALTLVLGSTLPAFSADMKEIGKGEGEVNIIAWAGYIERGESDKAYDWVTGFEKETGCKVNVKTAATSDEMVTLMNQGGSTSSPPRAMPPSASSPARRCSRSIPA